MQKRNYKLSAYHFNNYAKTKSKQNNVLTIVFYFPIINHQVENSLFNIVDHAILAVINDKFFKSEYWIYLKTYV